MTDDPAPAARLAAEKLPRDKPAPADGVAWAMIRLKFVTGGQTLAALAAAEGVSYNALRKRASRDGWTQAKHKMAQNVTETVAIDTRQSRAQELIAWNKADVAAAAQVRILAAAHVTAAIERGATIPPLDLRTLASALESAQRIARLALGVSTTNTELTGAGGADLAPGPTLADFYKMASKLRAPMPDDGE